MVSILFIKEREKKKEERENQEITLAHAMLETELETLRSNPLFTLLLPRLLHSLLEEFPRMRDF